MIATHVQKGEAVDFVPAADVEAGDVVAIGELVGVSQKKVTAGETGSLTVTGVFDLSKATGAGSAIAEGSKVFWDAGAQVATTADGGGANKYLGKTVLPAGDDDTGVRVRLSQ